MSTILQITSPSQNEYNAFVLEANGSFLQLWEWGSWQESFDKKVGRFMVTHNGKHVAACQVIIHTLPGYSYAYVPYGPIGLPSFGTDAIEALSAKIKATFPYICHTKFEPREESIVQVISSCKNFKINNRTNRQQTPNSLVLELTKDSDTLFAEMHPKTRYNIKVAQKHGLECWEDHNPAMVNLLYETGSRQGFKTHEQGYYEKMVKFFNKGNITTKLLCVGKNNVPYALGLFLDYDNIRTYLFGGSDYEYRKYMAPYLLHWQAVGDAKAQGFQTYDFWGLTNIHGKEVGFTRFKQGFGGKLLNFPNAIDVIYNPAKYKLFQLVRTIRSLI